MIAAFGPQAVRYEGVLRATGLADLEAVICDTGSLVAGHTELIERRYAGRPSYGMILSCDRRWQAIADATPAILHQYSRDYDLQCAALTSFGVGDLPINDGSVTSGSLWSEPAGEHERGLIAEFAQLAGALLVRSFAEYQRLVPLLKRPRAVETIVAVPSLPVPARERAERPSIVIWGPNRSPAEAAYHAFGLREFHGNVTCVTAPGPVPAGVTARFIESADPALRAVLATAACVVCVEPDDPGDAVAFARHGYGVVAPLTSGAHEFVRGVVPLKGEHLREVYVAAMIAAAEPAAARPFATPPLAPQPPALPQVSELPLVSVVTPTYNRREDLGLALQSLARQTYPRIEAIVVNDGGEPVDDLVAGFPFARLVNSPGNVGSINAVLMGVAAMTGAFLSLLADDDLLMPDHIERLVGALLRSGMSVAHGNTIIRYQEKNAAGEIETAGWNMSAFNDTATPTEALGSTPISGQALMFRREAWEAFGGMRGESILADQDMQLRATLKYSFAYVDAVTSDWGVRGDRNLTTKADSLPEIRRMYDELYPVAGRPLVREMRERIVAEISAREAGKFAFAPTVTKPVKT